MPSALPYLYCTPNDLYNQAGINPMQLALDDQNLASGQTVSTTADAAVGATSISVSALQYPLLRGTNLVFSNAGMDTPVEATLSAVATAGATSLTVSAIATAITSGATAADNGTNVWLAGMLAKACIYATDRVNMYCLDRYENAALANSWTVQQWAMKIAIRWVWKRLGRSSSQGIEEDYIEVMEELKAVKDNQLNVPMIGTRTSSWPAFSNVTINLLSDFRRVQVEPWISEPTATQYPQTTDWSSYWAATGLWA